MKIIMQTKIENLLNQSRRLNWAGNKSVYLPGKGTVIVDGAYPTACKNPRFVKQLESEISQGWIKLTIITNLATEAASSKKAPAPPVGKTTTKPKTVKDAGKSDQATVGGTAKEVSDARNGFVKLPEGADDPSPETIVMAGTEITEPPGTKSMLPPDASLNEVVGQTIEVPAEDEPAEEAAETPAEETPEEPEETEGGEGDAGDETPAEEAPKEPAAPVDDLDGLNRKQLVERAKEAGVKGNGTNDAIIQRIREKTAAE
jgi:hypothetical protein